MSAEPMMFTFLACSDLKRISESIATPPDLWSASASDNLAAAEDFAGHFARHCQLLAKNPGSGTERDELQPGLKSSPFRKYVIFYRLRGARVEILRVLRAGEDLGAAA
jgi:toxin ParE1/3/4